MKKKIIALGLVISTMLLSLTGCGSTDEQFKGKTKDEIIEMYKNLESSYNALDTDYNDLYTLYNAAPITVERK